MKSLKTVGLTAMIGTMLALSACGGNNDASSSKSSDSSKDNGTEQLSGQIKLDGSSTVYPIMEAIVEEYQAEQPNVKVSVASSGTGGGFKAFIAGETDFSNASRPIKDEEKSELESKGIDYTELRLAYDGLSVVVNKDNTWVDHLTLDELKKIWLEDGTTKKWSDIREGWPEEEIKYYSPGTDSGTFDYFDEVILEEQPIAKAATLSEDDNILVQGVTGDKNAIGYFGYAYYAENKDKLKVVPIDGGNGPVEPTNETVESGEYSPLSRPLFTYVKNESVKKDEVADFVEFMIENAADLSEDVGYVKLPDEEYKKDLELIEGLK
ncbi:MULTISPECIES: PstS family phosphate ABC transporter substrate-binding protein [Niallia]|jgi:phosphate transport system substrate-binding protein|uniref:Phosphate-binding protein n=1 Tax=Niallia circulans TaxID=1397 RepID=A0A268F6C7_NIACI|nr:PstS family phosphate ABC transporter substrate-binding protein [Niallia circulans]AYV67145.1 phosphate-binding protein [Niallia circulans]AYV74583.1 phosphate-binding protein [Niallia circulans]NRG26891.1 PstS family phosphate ABC transporter substrate-binding protein [Niallia circulans]PAD80941.1 phosphate-binding protein [Niallia circulans]QJX63107.1 PstS family phosphate ABC transporter substrate-binding protein [Niallia circulans]